MNSTRRLHRKATDQRLEGQLAPNIEADLAMKERALARLQEPDTKIQHYHPPDDLMQFLQAL